MTPRQLENTNYSENITASIFIGFAVQTLKFEATWCPKRIVDTATYLTNLALHQKYFEKSILASKYKKLVLFTATILYSVASISLEVNSECRCIFISWLSLEPCYFDIQQLFPAVHSLNLEAKFCSETPVNIFCRLTVVYHRTWTFKTRCESRT
jgi:hypothetical protein